MGEARKHGPAMLRNAEVCGLGARDWKLDLALKHVRQIEGGFALPVQRGLGPAMPDRLGLAIFEDASKRHVILMVLADAWQVLNHLDPMASQLCFITDAGLHEDFRRMDSTKGQDDVARCEVLVPLAILDDLDSSD